MLRIEHTTLLYNIKTRIKFYLCHFKGVFLWHRRERDIFKDGLTMSGLEKIRTLCLVLTTRIQKGFHAFYIQNASR